MQTSSRRCAVGKENTCASRPLQLTRGSGNIAAKFLQKYTLFWFPPIHEIKAAHRTWQTCFIIPSFVQDCRVEEKEVYKYDFLYPPHATNIIPGGFDSRTRSQDEVADRIGYIRLCKRCGKYKWLRFAETSTGD